MKVAQRERFWWLKYCVSDKLEAVKWTREGDTNIKLGITHKKNKIVRIFGELRHSIQTHETRFDWICEATTFMAQLLAFPKGKYDDGPDACGMIKDELLRRWRPKRILRRKEAPAAKVKRLQAEKRFKESKEPWLVIQKGAQQRARSRVLAQKRKNKQEWSEY
jgi:hypothetical protein